MSKSVVLQLIIRDITGSPVNDANILIKRNEWSEFVTVQPETPPNFGHYEIRNILPGRYQIQVISGNKSCDLFERVIPLFGWTENIIISEPTEYFYYSDEKKVWISSTEYLALNPSNPKPADFEQRYSDLIEEYSLEEIAGLSSDSCKVLQFTSEANTELKAALIEVLDESALFHEYGKYLFSTADGIAQVMMPYLHVEFKNNVSPEQQIELAAAHNFSVTKARETSCVFVYTGFPEYAMCEAMNAVFENEIVSKTYPFISSFELRSTGLYFPNDKLFPGQYYLSVMNLPEAWDLTLQETGSAFGSGTTIVAVVDTGIQTVAPNHDTFQHPDFAGASKYHFAFDYNTTLGGANMQKGNPAPSNSHGTSTSGIIVGLADNNLGVTGISGASKLLAVQSNSSQPVATVYFEDMYQHLLGFDPGWTQDGVLYNNGVGGQSFPQNFQVTGLLSANNPDATIVTPPFGASIINQSYKTNTNAGLFPRLKAALRQGGFLGRNRRGSILVTAAGNDDQPFTNVTDFDQGADQIIVSASTIDYKGNETKAPFSNYAVSSNIEPGIDFCAPSNSDIAQYTIPGVINPVDGVSNFAPPSTVGVTTTSTIGGGGMTDTIKAQGTLSGTENIGSTSLNCSFPGATAATYVGVFAYAMIQSGSSLQQGDWVQITNFSGTPTAPVLALAHPLNKKYLSGTKVFLFDNTVSKDYTPAFGGTSAAAPMVSGVAALIHAVNPYLTWFEVRKILRQTAVPVCIKHRGPYPPAVTNPGGVGYPYSSRERNWVQFNIKDRIASGFTHLLNADGTLDTTPQLGASVLGIFSITSPSNASSGEYKINLPAHALLFEERTAVLLGAQTTVSVAAVPVVATPNIITVTNASAFAVGDIITIERDSETIFFDIDKQTALNGANRLWVNVQSTDGFQKNDVIEFIDADNSNTVVFTDTINDFGLFGLTAPQADGENGSSSRIILTNGIPPGTLNNGISTGSDIRVRRKFYDQFKITATNTVGAHTITVKEVGGAVVNNVNDWTINAAVPNTYPIGTVIKTSKTEIKAVVKVDRDINGIATALYIDKPETGYVNADTVLVAPGKRADYSFMFGYGRINAVAAVQTAIDYHTDPINRPFADLTIRNFLLDDGDTANRNAAGIQPSPDIWSRNNDDLDGIKVDNSKDGPHQQPGIFVKIISHSGSGPDDLTVEGKFTDVGTKKYIISIDASQTSFMWKLDDPAGVNSVPILITAGIPQAIPLTGFFVIFGSANYPADNTWTIQATNKKRTVYVRVQNPGGADSFSPTVVTTAFYKVRAFIALVDAASSPTLSDYIIDNLPSADINVNSLKLTNANAYPSILLGEVEVSDTIKSNENKIFKFDWQEDQLPKKHPANAAVPGTIKRLYLLGEVTPHDGPILPASIGDSPLNNNNLSCREILLADFFFNNGTGAQLPYQLNPTTTNTQQFKLRVRAIAGAFTSEKIKIELRRKPAGGGPEEISVYENTGGGFAFTGPAPAWANFSANQPVVTGSVVVAAGWQIDVTFEGQFINIDATTLQYSINVIVGNPEGFAIASSRQDIYVADPANDPNLQAGTETNTDKSTFYFFAAYDLLQAQTIQAMAFGPVSNLIYNTTSLHKASANALAIATVDGDIVAQPNNDDVGGSTINLILRAKSQGGIPGMKVKYFVYRGILKSSLVAPASVNLQPSDSLLPGSGDMLKTIKDNVVKLHAANNAISDIPTISSLRLDILAPAVADNDPLEKLFDNATAPDFIPVPVKAGQAIGQFKLDGSNAIGFGFDIILDDRYDKPKAIKARKQQNLLEVTNLMTAAEAKALRRKSLIYIDPAAFYGMLLYTKRVKAYNSATNTFELLQKYSGNGSHSVYDALLKGAANVSPTISSLTTDSLFFNDGVVYLDIRTGLGLPYNYGNDYGDNIYLALADKDNSNQDINPISQSFLTNDWPIKIINDTSFNTANSDIDKSKNVIRLFLPLGNNDNPYIYLVSGSTYKRHPNAVKQKKRFIQLKPNPDVAGFTKEIRLGAPNIKYVPNTQSGAWYLKMYYIRQKENTSTLAPGTIVGGVPAQNHHFDYAFSTSDVSSFFASTAQVRYKSGIGETFVDGENTIGFSGYCNTGCALENGRVTFFLTPKDTLSNKVSGNTLYREVLSGTSSKTSFFDVLKNVYPDLSVKKRELQFTSGNIPYLELSGNDLHGRGKHLPYSFMGISMTQGEFTTVTASIASLDQALHPVTFNVRATSTGSDDAGNGYQTIEMGICGYDSAGTFTELSPTLTFYSTNGMLGTTPAAATAEPVVASSLSQDLTLISKDGNINVYRRLKIYTPSVFYWNIFDAAGAPLIYDAGETDYLGNNIAGNFIELPVETRVVIVGKAVLQNAPLDGSTEYYRILCWHRNKFRDGYVHIYSVPTDPAGRVNIDDFTLVDDTILVESFLNDATLELYILDKLFNDPVDHSALAPGLYNLFTSTQALVNGILASLNISGGQSVQYTGLIANGIRQLVQSNFHTIDQDNIPKAFRDFTNLPSMQLILMTINVVNISFSAYSAFADIPEKNENNQFPFLSDNLRIPGDSVGAGDVPTAKAEFQALLTKINTDYPSSDPIFQSNDYLRLVEILGPANSTDGVITLDEAVKVLFLPPVAWPESYVRKTIQLQSEVPVDQSMGYIESSTQFTMFVNESNVGIIDQILMLTDTHHDSGLRDLLWKYLNQGNSLSATLTYGNSISSSVHEGESLKHIFMRNSEIGVIYLYEYINAIL
jgi:hypothetical protein